jgi:hypothetical protein
MNYSFFPKARKRELLTTKVADETVVYDLETDKASCLDALTTMVWDACDGYTDTALLLDKIKRSGYQDANIDLVWLAIDQLERAGLLEEPNAPNLTKSSASRRELFRILGAGALGALPVISTINVQPALAAISVCLPKNSRCTSHGQCCSNYCKNSDGKCK